MKNTGKKILAVIMAMVMLLSVFSVMASAKTYPKIDGVKLKETRYVKVGDTFSISKLKNATGIQAAWYGSNSDSVQYAFNKSENPTKVTFLAVCEGVELFLVENYDKNYDTIDRYYFAVVVESDTIKREDMGTINEIFDISMEFTYKDMTDPYLYAEIDADYGDAGVWFVEYYVPDVEDSEIYVDETGGVDVFGTGSAYGTYYVIDAQGNFYYSTYYATVSYTWWQQIIRYVLLGFLWY